MAYCLESKLVKYGGNYGSFDLNSIYFDDSQNLGGTESAFLQYMIKKIKIFTRNKDNNEYIIGIQLSYLNLITKEIKDLPIRKGSEDYNNEDIKTFELNPGEYLINYYIRLSNDLELINELGFETNKKRIILVGREKGEEKNINSNGGNNIIVGTFGHYNKKLESLGIQYVNLDDYTRKFYRAYFELKFKIKKHEKYKQKLDAKYTSLKESDKYLFKACLLPDGAFSIIMKYCIF